MVERSPLRTFLTHAVLLCGLAVVCFPVYYAFTAATLPLEEVSKTPMPLVPGGELINNLREAWNRVSLGRMLFNSAVMAIGVAVGKIAISLLSAFAITYFRFRFRQTAFWLIFVTLMLPVEVRILPTYEVAANLLGPLQKVVDLLGIEALVGAVTGLDVSIRLEWSLLDSYTGLIMPLVASATATFLFRQFFLTVPEEICEAAKMDGATPMRFFRDILFPMSRTNLAALMVILFVYGWNQYLWPLLITTNPDLRTIVIGLDQLRPNPDQAPEWNLVMAASLLALLPPVGVVVFMQRWFVKGLVETEK